MLEHSLEGKWIALAGLWLRHNMPCPVSQYYEQVMPMMPMHIRDPGTKKTYSQLRLTRRALRMLRVILSEDKNTILSVRKESRTGTPRSDAWQLDVIRQHEKPDGTISLSASPEGKREAFRIFLSRYGYKVTDVPGVYRKSQSA